MHVAPIVVDPQSGESQGRRDRPGRSVVLIRPPLPSSRGAGSVAGAKDVALTPTLSLGERESGRRRSVVGDELFGVEQRPEQVAQALGFGAGLGEVGAS